MHTALRTFPALRLTLPLAIGALAVGCAHGPAAFSAADLASKRDATLKKYVKTDNEDVFKRLGNKVYIGQFQVEFIDSCAASASEYSTNGDTSHSSHVDVTYNLKNVDTTTFQQLTDGLYQGFVAELKSRGIDTVSIDELKGKDQYQKLLTKGEANGSEQPSRLQADSSAKALVFAPTGMPVIYTFFNPKLSIKAIFAVVKGEQPENFIANLSDEMKVPLVAVQMIVGFAQLKTSGGSSEPASVGAQFRFSVASNQTLMTIVPSDKMSIDSGKTRSAVKWDKGAKVWIKEPIFSDKSFVNGVVDATATSTKVAEGAVATFYTLSALTGHSGSTSSSTSRIYDLRADPVAYKQIGNDYLGYIRTMFMATIDKNK
jgi:hypothetical protein